MPKIKYNHHSPKKIFIKIKVANEAEDNVEVNFSPRYRDNEVSTPPRFIEQKMSAEDIDIWNILRYFRCNVANEGQR